MTTTAVFSGSVKVCINYTGINFGNESRLKLYHLESGACVDRTVPGSLDTTNNIICASVTSLSPFAIFEGAACSTTAEVTANFVTKGSTTAKQAASGWSCCPSRI